jgi:hypothetical protein
MDFHINRRSRDTGSKVTLYMIINTYVLNLLLIFWKVGHWILKRRFRSISMAWECGAVERMVGITIANQIVVSNHFLIR